MGIWGSKVVAVDDDVDTLDLVQAILRAQGACVVGVSAPVLSTTEVRTATRVMGDARKRRALQPPV